MQRNFAFEADAEVQRTVSWYVVPARNNITLGRLRMRRGHLPNFRQHVR
jgi:hypothetical protein